MHWPGDRSVMRLPVVLSNSVLVHIEGEDLRPSFVLAVKTKYMYTVYCKISIAESHYCWVFSPLYVFIFFVMTIYTYQRTYRLISSVLCSLRLSEHAGGCSLSAVREPQAADYLYAPSSLCVLMLPHLAMSWLSYFDCYVTDNNKRLYIIYIYVHA